MTEVIAKVNYFRVNACDIINLSNVSSDVFSVLTKDCTDVEISFKLLTKKINHSFVEAGPNFLVYISNSSLSISR